MWGGGQSRRVVLEQSCEADDFDSGQSDGDSDRMEANFGTDRHRGCPFHLNLSCWWIGSIALGVFGRARSCGWVTAAAVGAVRGGDREEMMASDDRKRAWILLGQLSSNRGTPRTRSSRTDHPAHLPPTGDLGFIPESRARGAAGTGSSYFSKPHPTTTAPTNGFGHANPEAAAAREGGDGALQHAAPARAARIRGLGRGVCQVRLVVGARERGCVCHTRQNRAACV